MRPDPIFPPGVHPAGGTSEGRLAQHLHQVLAVAVLQHRLGLRFQLPPHAQGKLVRVVQGRVFDVAVDIRRSSPTFGRWVGVELSADNHRQFWIPPGFAHGFTVLSDTADFLYKTTDFHAPQAEGWVRWNDPALGIEWPDAAAPRLLSAKDEAAPLLADAPRLFD